MSNGKTEALFGVEDFRWMKDEWDRCKYINDLGKNKKDEMIIEAYEYLGLYL